MMGYKAMAGAPPHAQQQKGYVQQKGAAPHDPFNPAGRPGTGAGGPLPGYRPGGPPLGQQAPALPGVAPAVNSQERNQIVDLLRAIHGKLE